MKIIGVSGFARSGKDLFTTVAQKLLIEQGLKTEKYALAYELKNDLKAAFVILTIDLDSFKTKNRAKSSFR